MKLIIEDIRRGRELMGLLLEGTSYNDLVAQVREVGLRAADLKTLKKEVESDDTLTNTERNKLTKLIDSKLDETGLNEWDDYRYLRTDESNGVKRDLGTTLHLAPQGEFYEHEDDRPDNWRQLPGYNPDYFYDDDWKELKKKYSDKKEDDEVNKDSILDRFKKAIYSISNEQSDYNKKHNLPSTWRGSKEGYHEYITNKKFPSGSNE
jgi:hypothetical protein